VTQGQPTRFGYVVALPGEQRALRRGYARVRAARAPTMVRQALGAAAAHTAAQRLVADGANVLVSFGVAAGLKRGLQTGTVLIADRVCWQRQDYLTDGAIVAALAAPDTGLAPIRVGAHLGYADIVHAVADKQSLYETHAALGLDQESGAVAAAASDAGVSVVVVRVIVDSAMTPLPAQVARWNAANGTTRYGQLALDVIRSPGLILALPRMARQFDVALRQLERAGAILAGIGLGNA
jgi:adenosylhomocysteine nucleosidase